MDRSSASPTNRGARLKVLFIIESLGTGGAETGLANLAVTLLKYVDVHVAMLAPPDTMRRELEAGGVVVHDFPPHGRWALGTVGRRMRQLQRDHRFDILHAHLLDSEIAQALVPRRKDKPRKVITFHNLGYDAYPASNLRSKLLKAVRGLVIRRTADLTTAVAAPAADSYARHLGLKDLRVLPLPVPAALVETAEVDRARVLAAYGISTDRFVILQVGRLSEEKNHDVALAAIERLRDHPKRPALLIVGAGPLEKHLRERTSALPGLVYMHGPMRQRDIFELYRSVNAAWLPSRTEAFPLVALEAMTAGLPLVASNVGGIAAMTNHGEHALLVPSGDSSALAEAARAIMDDPESAAKRAKSGRKAALEEYGAESICARWVKLYEEILSRTA